LLVSRRIDMRGSAFLLFSSSHAKSWVADSRVKLLILPANRLRETLVPLLSCLLPQAAKMVNLYRCLKETTKHAN